MRKGCFRKCVNSFKNTFAINNMLLHLVIQYFNIIIQNINFEYVYRQLTTLPQLLGCQDARSLYLYSNKV